MYGFPTASHIAQRAAFMLLIVASAVCFSARYALADAPAPSSPSPAPGVPAQPTPEQAAAMKAEMLKKLDPCGGPLELLNKEGITPCVLISGQTEFSAGYANIDIPGNAVIGRRRSFTIPFHATVDAYPLISLGFGVGPRSQFTFTFPTYAYIATDRRGLIADGITDIAFEYKQRLSYDPNKHTITGFSVKYTAPTGSPALTGEWPKYTAQLLISQPITQRIKLNASLAFGNEVVAQTSDGSFQRGWDFSPTLLAVWVTPGGTLLGALGQHSFNPNRTSVAAVAEQLLSRHVMLQAAYGGVDVATQAEGPIAGIFTVPIAANPRLFTANIYYLFGRSDLPQKPSPANQSSP